MQLEDISVRKKKKYLSSGMKLEEYTVVDMKWMSGWKPFSAAAQDIIYFINPHRPAHDTMNCLINNPFNRRTLT